MPFVCAELLLMFGWCIVLHTLISITKARTKTKFAAAVPPASFFKKRRRIRKKGTRAGAPLSPLPSSRLFFLKIHPQETTAFGGTANVDNPLAKHW